MAVSEAADARLKAFLSEPAMLVVAAADAQGRPALGRAMGVLAAPDGDHLDILVSASQWPRVLEALAPGKMLALTLCRPSTYETLQVKGPVRSIGPAGAEGIARAGAYVETVGRHLAGLGVLPEQMAPWLQPQDLLQIRFAPASAFEQTPGPRAGRPVGGP